MCEDLLFLHHLLACPNEPARYVSGSTTSDVGLEEGLTAC